MASNFNRRVLGLILIAALTAHPRRARAKVEGYPYLDNETIGLFNLLSDGLAGKPGEFDLLYWGDISLEKTFGTMLGFTRYLAAASSYAVAAAAEHSPAYRAPYKEAMERAIGKMLHHRSWNDWLTTYGDDPIAKDNLMFKGFLFYMMVQYQRLFDDRRYEKPVTMVSSGGKSFTTDLKSLAALLAKEQAQERSVQGEAHHNIACEPGQVFIMCNTQHRVGFEIYDRLYGTTHGASAKAWLDWVRASMIDPTNGLIYFMYRPKKSRDQQLVKTMSGLFIGISIAFIDALDHNWAMGQLYPRFKKEFVLEDSKSPHGAGTAVAMDQVSQKTDLISFALNIATTGMAQIMARAQGESALYDKLVQGFNGYLGKPAWEPGESRYGYTFMRAIPLMFQNAVPLWARATDAKHNIRKNTVSLRPASFFKQPYVSAVSNPKAFVNQAVYDNANSRLLVTVNGGKATSESTAISVAGLDRAKYYSVTRNGALHNAVAWNNNLLVITTPALSSKEESYLVEEAEAPPIGEGCSLNANSGAGAGSWFLLLLAAGLAARVSLRQKP